MTPDSLLRRTVVASLSLLIILLAGCRAKKAAVGVGASRPVPEETRPGRIVPQEADYASLPDPTRRLLAEADSWIGTPYRYGGAERGRGADCSGFVMAAYANALSLKLPRSSREQQQWCAPVKGGVQDAIPGDLVFFTTGKNRGSVNHVGIYLGKGRVVHASSSRGVIVSDLSEPYYTRTYHSTGRVESYYAMLDTPTAPASQTPDGGSRVAHSGSLPPDGDSRVVPSVPDSTLTPEEARRLLLRRLAEADTVTTDK